MNSNSTETREIRRFGLIALLLFGGLSAGGIWFGKPIQALVFGILSALGIGFVLFPKPLRPVFNGWLKITHFIGKAISTVSLILIYYFVIPPAAIIKRTTGGPPLPIKPDKRRSTYWVSRKVPAQAKEQYTKRF